MHSKPLYQAQKQIEYQKHLERLNKITKKKKSLPPQNSLNQIQTMHKRRHFTSEFYMKQRKNTLDHQNNKILTSIISIAQRKKIPSYSTIVSHSISKKQHPIITFNNPQRKKKNQQILQDNDKLARRLMTKQSQFDRSKVYKAIEQYQKIKTTMKNNRRVRLVPVKNNRHGGFDFARISTVQNSRVDLKNSSVDEEVEIETKKFNNDHKRRIQLSSQGRDYY